jgi:hypothetical protein
LIDCQQLIQIVLKQRDRLLFLLLAGVDVVVRRRLDVGVSGQLAHRRQRHPSLQEHGAERVPELVRVHPEPQLPSQTLQHRVDRVLVQLVGPLADQQEGTLLVLALLPIRPDVFFDQVDQVGTERYLPVLPSLARHTERAGEVVDVTELNAAQLAHPNAGVEQQVDNELIAKTHPAPVLDEKEQLVNFLLGEHLHFAFATCRYFYAILLQRHHQFLRQLTLDQEQVERLQGVDLLVDRRHLVLGFNQVVLVAGYVEAFQVSRILHAHSGQVLGEDLHVADVGFDRLRRDPVLDEVLFELADHVHLLTPPEMQKSRRSLSAFGSTRSLIQ